MSTAPRTPGDYATVSDPERALKYAIRHIRGDRTEIIEGVITVITPMSPSWAHESAAEVVRRQITPRTEELDPVSGSGNLDLPGSENWYVPGAPVHLPAPFDLDLDTTRL